MKDPQPSRAMLGVDIGGTFTDVILVRDGKLVIHKVLSTSPNPASGLLKGIADLEPPQGTPLVHGSTVATNAVLERKGARTALITTAGFRDVLEIGRQTRPSLYDLAQTRPAPLVPRHWRFEIRERLDYTGAVLTPVEVSDVAALIPRLRDEGIEAVAICFLFSFLNPAHEQQVAAILKEALPDIALSLSSSILPEYREYERSSTVVLNAYIAPRVSHYLGYLEQQRNAPLRIMQSSGGSVSAALAAAQPVRTVLSGPAGGVVGAFRVAALASFDQVITFDMGGTSTDVALCPGHIQETSEASIGGFPVRIPVLDIYTVGAGGGSLARLDAGGALTVGPESAGANPGPVCYGRGQNITVTDANLVLGRLNAAHFLGGTMALDLPRTLQALQPLAASLGGTLIAAAEGILRVANSNMERAIRVVSVERGFDPRLFTLVAFGGAGPLHACDLAENLGVRRVLIPRYPGVLSAMGMLLAGLVKDYSQTVLRRTGPFTTADLEPVYAHLEDYGRRELAQEQGEEGAPFTAQRLLDLRYAGQSYEITVDYTTLEEAAERFHRQHEQRFGYSHVDQPIEPVTARLKLIQAAAPIPLGGNQALAAADLTPPPPAARLKDVPIVFKGQELPTSCYQRELLPPGCRIPAPAALIQYDTTTIIPTGWEARVDRFSNLIVEYQA